VSYSLELLHKVARLYYEENLKQESIGRKLQISRYKVCRVLQKAKDRGLVKIKVIDPNNNENI
jgi:deoxyribonucleoside regulator